MAYLEQFINIYYLIAVIFTTEAFNKNIPAFKRMRPNWATLIVSAIVLVVFYLIEQPKNDKEYLIKMFVSFMAAVSMYDFVMKPIKDKMKTPK